MRRIRVTDASRPSLVDGREFVVGFAYGCEAHALTNFCEDIAKRSLVKTGIAQALYVSMTVKNQGLLNKIYSSLSKDIVGKEYAMALYYAS